MKTDKMILGKDCCFGTDGRKTGLNNNVVVIGGSGCGKTRYVLEPRLWETKESNLIVAVSKRRLVKTYRKLFQERGYETEELNFIEPQKSEVGYDLLAYVRSNEDIVYLANAIVMADARKVHCGSDPYWDQCAISLLAAIISLVMETKKKPSFSQVLEMVRYMKVIDSSGTISTTLDSFFRRQADRDPDCFSAACWKSFQVLPIKTAGCVLSTLNTTIDTVFTTDICEMIKTKKSVDFREFAQKKKVLFVSTSAVNPSLNSLVNMFYAQGIKELFELAEARPDGVLPIPLALLCDDFAVGGQIHNFPEFISIFREKNISVTMLLQSESQLEQMYGSGNAVTIINNCDTYLYMGGMDLKTAESISQRINTPLDEVLYMPVGESVLIRRGQRPIRCERYPVEENPIYRRVEKEYRNMLEKEKEQAEA